MSNVRIIVKTQVANFLITSVYYLYSKNKGNLVFSFLRKVYYSLLKKFGMSVMPILDFDTYHTNYNSVEVIPIKSKRIGLSGNCVFLDNIEKQKTIPMPLPDIRMHKLSDVTIFGNSDIVVDLQKKIVINNECYNHDKDLFYVDGMLYRDKNNLCILRTNFKQSPEKIDDGIMINGKFSYNYFHQIYENLIRLLLLEEVNIPLAVPILIDEKVKQISSFQSILVCLNTSKRNVIYLKSDKQYDIKNLYYLEHINKLSPHVVNWDDTSYRHFIYDPYYVNKMSDVCLRDKSTALFPKRFYISRKNAVHRKFNDDDIAKALVPYGFQVVYPEEHSFAEQMALFSGAEFIIGGTGAAFANLLFCNKGAKVVIINPIANHIQLPVFSIIAYIRKCQLYYYEPQATSSDSVHADCMVDTQDFLSKLQKII